MKSFTTNKKFKTLLILGLVFILTLMSTVVAFADSDNPLSDENQYVGEVTTGYDQAYSPLIEFIGAYLTPFLSLIIAVGMLYCVVLGVKYARAEEPQEREKAKKNITNFLVGIILIFVVWVVLKLAMPVFSELAYDETKNIDKESLQNVSDATQHEGYVDIEIYQKSDDDEDTVANLRNRDSDYNTVDPTTTVNENVETDEEAALSGENAEEDNGIDEGDGTYSSPITNSGQNSTVVTEYIADCETAISEFNTAYTNYITSDTTSTEGYKYYKTLKGKASAVSSALNTLLSVGDESDSQVADVLTRGNECITRFNELESDTSSDYED